MAIDSIRNRKGARFPMNTPEEDCCNVCARGKGIMVKRTLNRSKATARLNVDRETVNQ